MNKSLELIKEIWAYREMIIMLVRRELRGRYKGSFLGFAWTFINPLLQLGVYTMVFSVVLRSGIQKYYLFLFVALIPWLAMSTSVNGAASCITANSNMVKKIYFPRQILPITIVTTNFINMLLCMVVVLLVCGFSIGLNPVALLYLVPTFIIEYILALGIAMIVSGVTVYFRDMQYFLSIFTLAWQFLTPIMYSFEQVPEKYLKFYMLNPMTPIIYAYRQILYYKSAPDMSAMLSSLLMGCLFLAVGWVSFQRLERHFAEAL